MVNMPFEWGYVCCDWKPTLSTKSNRSPHNTWNERLCNNKPGIELFWHGATPILSSPQQRFTSEFGKGSVWFHRTIDTRKTCRFQSFHFKTLKTAYISIRMNYLSRSSPRSVRTSLLHTLLYFHIKPINGCSPRDLTYSRSENTHLKVGFPLRCFQRLSSPNLATQRLLLAE